MALGLLLVAVIVAITFSVLVSNSSDGGNWSDGAKDGTNWSQILQAAEFSPEPATVTLDSIRCGAATMAQERSQAAGTSKASGWSLQRGKSACERFPAYSAADLTSCWLINAAKQAKHARRRPAFSGNLLYRDRLRCSISPSMNPAYRANPAASLATVASGSVHASRILAANAVIFCW
jgi:hypothetical protein